MYVNFMFAVCCVVAWCSWVAVVCLFWFVWVVCLVLLVFRLLAVTLFASLVF